MQSYQYVYPWDSGASLEPVHSNALKLARAILVELQLLKLLGPGVVGASWSLLVVS